MEANRRATLRDIAGALGLSVNTVSRALTDKDQVSEQTRRLIRAEAERIGYVPNSGARSLVLGSTMTIGLAITNPSNPFYAQLISAIETHARAAGYSLLLGISEESAELESVAADSFLRAGVDGAIVVPVQSGPDPWQRLRRARIPAVLINRDLPRSGLDMVGTDNAAGAYRATRAVLDRGARSVVMLEEDLPVTTIVQRISGYRKAMAEDGLDATHAQVIKVPTRRHDQAALPWQADEGYRLAQELLDGREVDAVVVGNDYFALGLYRAISERGLRVPEDIAVVGFGDYPFAGYLNPGLSTIRLPSARVGQVASELLLARIAGHGPRRRARRLITPELVERGSLR